MNAHAALSALLLGMHRTLPRDLADIAVRAGVTATEAERLMLAVHHDGRAIVAEGAREQMELHTQAMHDYGLWATVRKATDS